MQVISNRRETSDAIRNDLGAIFVSMELSRSTWLITSLSPGAGEKMSKHTLPAGDIGALFGTQAEGVDADWKIVPDHCHSRSGTGRLLDSPRSGERGD